MEAAIKFIVVLTITAGILWVLSPLFEQATTVTTATTNVKVVSSNFEKANLPDTQCYQNLCEVNTSGVAHNDGAAAKNILLSLLFFDLQGKNIGSVNLPMIANIASKQSASFLFTTNFSCDAVNANVIVLHAEKA
jgi:hypothetical protein